MAETCAGAGTLHLKQAKRIAEGRVSAGDEVLAIAEGTYMYRAVVIDHAESFITFTRLVVAV